MTTSDCVAAPSEEVTTALQAKHPPADQDEELPLPPDIDDTRLTVTEDDVLAAILAFPTGSAAGLDGVRPMHLRQLVSKNTAEAGRRLLGAITNLCNAAIVGNIPDTARQAFFSANLVALKKKDGGLRPIAVGSIYRRLAGKLVSKHMTSALSAQLRPVQLGVGTPLGCEAAVHAVREFTDDHTGHADHIILNWTSRTPSTLCTDLLYSVRCISASLLQRLS